MHRPNRWHTAMISLAIAACVGSKVMTGADAGTAADAGTIVDAGRTTLDAGPNNDGGNSADGGNVTDAGIPSDGGDAGDGGPLTLAGFTQQEVTALCQLWTQCGVQPPQSIGGCVEGLLVENDAPDNPALIPEAVDAGRMTFNPDAGASCLAAIQAQDCSTLLRFFAGFDAFTLSAPQACAAAFSGTVPSFGHCLDDFECVPGDFCWAASDLDGGGCGECFPMNPACDNDWQCPQGQACDLGSHECGAPVTLPGSGDGCDNDYGCATGYYCNTDLQNPVCVALGQDGESCPYGGPPYSCATGLTCTPIDDEGDGICQPWAPDTCGNVTCGGSTTIQTVCDSSTESCVPWPASGPCLEGVCDRTQSYCDTTASPPVCRPYVADGATCTTDTAALQCDVYSDCEGSGSTGICTRIQPICIP